MVIPIQKNGFNCDKDICEIDHPILNKPTSFISELRHLRKVIINLVDARSKENFNELSKMLNILGEAANEYNKDMVDRSKLITILKEIANVKEE